LNHHYTGFVLEAIRADLLTRLAKEKEQYAMLARNALVLCDPTMLGQGSAQRIYIEGAAQMRRLRNSTIKCNCGMCSPRLKRSTGSSRFLANCIDTPDPVHVQIGVKGMDSAGEHLA